MATRYYQNKRSNSVVVPSAEGATFNIPPWYFVIDLTGSYYNQISGLTEVTAHDIDPARVAYTYGPTAAVTVNPSTGRIAAEFDQVVYGAGLPSSVPGAYATVAQVFPLGPR